MLLADSVKLVSVHGYKFASYSTTAAIHVAVALGALLAGMMIICVVVQVLDSRCNGWKR